MNNRKILGIFTILLQAIVSHTQSITQDFLSPSSSLAINNTGNININNDYLSYYHNTTVIASTRTKFDIFNGFDTSKHNILEISSEKETSMIDFNWINYSPSSTSTSVGDNLNNLRRTQSSSDEIVIYVLGDIPYTQNEARTLSKQIQNIPSDARFIVHVGDIMSPETGCPEEWYIDVKNRLLQSNVPVFITPGDNDWSDCSNPNQAWQYWYRHFNRFDKQFRHNLPVVRQDVRKENVAFFLDNYALFIMVHLIGLPIRNKDEWNSRIKDDIDFTTAQIIKYSNRLSVIIVFGHTKPRSEHDDFFKPLYKLAKQIGKPVFYVHGDGHVFNVEGNVDGLQNFIDIEVDQGRKAPPLKIVVQRDAMKIARDY